jgi:acylphosphatase
VIRSIIEYLISKHLLKPPANLVRASLMIRGRLLVRGGYADELQKSCYANHLKGWMRAHDSFIEMDVEGQREQIEKMLNQAKIVSGWCQVEYIEFAWDPTLKIHRGFRRRE